MSFDANRNYHAIYKNADNNPLPVQIGNIRPPNANFQQAIHNLSFNWKNQKGDSQTVGDTILFYTKGNEHKPKLYKELNPYEETRMFPKIYKKDGRRYSTRKLFRGKAFGPRPSLCYKRKGRRNPRPSG